MMLYLLAPNRGRKVEAILMEKVEASKDGLENFFASHIQVINIPQWRKALSSYDCFSTWQSD